MAGAPWGDEAKTHQQGSFHNITSTGFSSFASRDKEYMPAPPPRHVNVTDTGESSTAACIPSVAASGPLPLPVVSTNSKGNGNGKLNRPMGGSRKRRADLISVPPSSKGTGEGGDGPSSTSTSSELPQQQKRLRYETTNPPSKASHTTSSVMVESNVTASTNVGGSSQTKLQQGQAREPPHLAAANQSAAITSPPTVERVNRGEVSSTIDPSLVTDVDVDSFLEGLHYE